MKGKLVIETIQRGNEEGLSVLAELEDVTIEDRFQMLTAVAQSLKMPRELVGVWSTMYRIGVMEGMFSKETVYDHSRRETPPVGDADSGPAAQ